MKSCYGQIIPNYNSPLLEYSFWPKWDSTGTRNTNLVEPDLFIKAKEYDIIIEAKRFDYNQQSPEQWESEFQAYLNEYGELERKVYLIALGGIYGDDIKSETIMLSSGKYSGKEIQIIKSRWTRILKIAKEIHSKLAGERYTLSAISSVYNIIGDIILGFKIHGYFTGEWFDMTDFSNLTNIKFNYFELLEGAHQNSQIDWSALSQYKIDAINYELLV